jgi:hypothetical protein
MKIDKCKVGMVVYHKLLGKGTIQRVKVANYLISVLWDINPPLDYNCGFNPCLVFPEDLKND